MLFVKCVYRMEGCFSLGFNFRYVAKTLKLIPLNFLLQTNCIRSMKIKTCENLISEYF